jgi:hypothetical protein
MSEAPQETGAVITTVTLLMDIVSPKKLWVNISEDCEGRTVGPSQWPLDKPACNLRCQTPPASHILSSPADLFIFLVLTIFS